MLVRVCQRVGGWRVPEDSARGRRPAAPFAQRGAVHILHRDERDATDVTDLVDGADIRMVQGGGIAGLTQHARPGRLVVALVVYDLQRDLPTEHRVEGEEHDSHSPATEDSLDAVGAEHLTGFCETGRRLRLSSRDGRS